MTEKRSSYRRKQERKKGKKLLSKFKAAFDDEDASLDVNPAFKRDNQQIENSQERTEPADEEKGMPADVPVVDKGLQLKKKLDRAILIVFVLIVLVLLALFYL